MVGDGAGVGAGAEATAVVGRETAAVELPVFEGVTITASVAPTSAVCTRYDENVALEIGVQLAPAVSHRAH